MQKNEKKPEGTFFTYLNTPLVTGWHSLIEDWGTDDFGPYIILSLSVAKISDDFMVSGTGRILIGNQEIVYSNVRKVNHFARHYVNTEGIDLHKGMVVNVERD